MAHLGMYSTTPISAKTTRRDVKVGGENAPCPARLTLATEARVSFPCHSHFNEKRKLLRLAARQACPRDIQELTAQLLRDLPSYANRIYQQYGVPGYVLVAGRPEFQPLPLGPGQLATVPQTLTDPKGPQQIFITTLERHYEGTKAVELQQYHWIFLAQTDSGWRLATMYSIIGPYPAGYPPSPPQESSDGSIAAAIQIWLRDCRSKTRDQH